MRRIPLILSLLLAVPAFAADPKGPKIDPLIATANGSEVTVHFGLQNAFADPRRIQELESGVPTSITYIVEIFRARPNWLDEGIGRTRIEVVATFNSLTREYLLSYRRDRKLVRSETFTDLAALEQRMTTIDEPNLFPIGNRRPYKLKVRVKADLMRGWLLNIIPWEISTRWRVTRVATPPEAKPEVKVQGRR